MTSWNAIKSSFITGIVLLTPLLITLYILNILASFALQYIGPIAESSNLSQYTAEVDIIAQIVAVILIVVLVIILGAVAQRPAGQRLFGTMGRSIYLIPLVRTIYSTVRQISSSFSSAETSYDSLVMIEFPRKGVYSLGLATNESPQAVSDVAGTAVTNVFLPSSPNPASGRLVLVPEDQIYDIDLSVRQGLGLLMTTGATSQEVTEQLPDSIDISEEEATALQPANDAGPKADTPGVNGTGSDEDDETHDTDE